MAYEKYLHFDVLNHKQIKKNGKYFAFYHIFLWSISKKLAQNRLKQY